MEAEELPVPEHETSMEDADEFDGHDVDDIEDTDIEPDTEIEADEDDNPDKVRDFDLKPPPDDLVADDVDD